MKLLSLDIEATGLDANCYMIEIALVPFSTATKTIAKDLSFHNFVQCPPFETLKPNLDPWVIEHNKGIIEYAAQYGDNHGNLKKKLHDYLNSPTIKNYFSGEKITLFGKSMNAIDLPFLNRDLGWDFMRKYFNHKVMDLSSVAFAFIDLNFLPPLGHSGSELMKLMKMGEVAHTAMEDACNTAEMYLMMLEKIQKFVGKVPSNLWAEN